MCVWTMKEIKIYILKRMDEWGGGGIKFFLYIFLILPCFHRIDHSNQVWYRNVSMRCGMRRMSSQLMVARRCIEDRCADLREREREREFE